VLNEVEERGVRPVEILNHENGRSLRGKRLEITAPGGERLLPADTRDLVLGSDEWGETFREPRAIGLVLDELRNVP
jgi:hypothetical protein